MACTMKPVKRPRLEEKNADKEEDEKLDKDFINLLPNECLVIVFKYLSLFDRLEMEKVCARWEAVSKLAWSDIREFDCTWNDESNKWRMNQSDIQLVLQRCGFYLTKLVLLDFCGSSIMPYVTEYCPYLVNFEFQFWSINESDFVNAFTNMKELKIIKILTFAYDRAEPVNYPEILESLPEGMLEIHIFHTKDKSRLRINDLTLERFTSLLSLSLQNFSLDSTTCQQIAQKITLINLDLNNCSLDLRSCNLNQPLSISSLVNLERLNLESFWLSGDGPSPVSTINGCKKLKYLNIADSSLLISDVILQEIAELENLEHLMINNIENVEDTLFNGFSRLEVLKCSGCTNVTDIGIMKILKNCSMLQQLSIFETSITSGTLFYANEVTKSRQNNVILEISADLWNVEFFYEMEFSRLSNVSSLLALIPIWDESDVNDDFSQYEHDDDIYDNGPYPGIDYFDDDDYYDTGYI